MKKTIKRALMVSFVIALTIAISMLFNTRTAGETIPHIPEALAEEIPQLTHRQEVWMYVLEWCESRGDSSAINEVDLDGTSSWGAFQFKPATLDGYAKRYGVATTTLMNYETQHAVVTQMILHKEEINWHREFPDCVAKNGLPPND